MTLYIDPGTGSMLFTILIGILGTAGYLLRNVFVKLRFLSSGGAREKSASSGAKAMLLPRATARAPASATALAL